MNEPNPQKPSNRNYRCKKCEETGSHFTEHCPRNKCNRCGNMGHIGRNCMNETYQSLRNYNCGCNKKQITGSGYDTHCCICKERTPLTEMEISYNKKRARCRQCTEKNHRNTGSKRNNES